MDSKPNPDTSDTGQLDHLDDPNIPVKSEEASHEDKGDEDEHDMNTTSGTEHLRQEPSTKPRLPQQPPPEEILYVKNVEEEDASKTESEITIHAHHSFHNSQQLEESPEDNTAEQIATESIDEEPPINPTPTEGQRLEEDVVQMDDGGDEEVIESKEIEKDQLVGELNEGDESTEVEMDDERVGGATQVHEETPSAATMIKPTNLEREEAEGASEREEDLDEDEVELDSRKTEGVDEIKELNEGGSANDEATDHSTSAVDITTRLMNVALEEEAEVLQQGSKEVDDEIQTKDDEDHTILNVGGGDASTVLEFTSTGRQHVAEEPEDAQDNEENDNKSHPFSSENDMPELEDPDTYESAGMSKDKTFDPTASSPNFKTDAGRTTTKPDENTAPTSIPAIIVTDWAVPPQQAERPTIPNNPTPEVEAEISTIDPFEPPPVLPWNLSNVPRAVRHWMVDLQAYMVGMQQSLEKLRKTCEMMKSCECKGSCDCNCKCNKDGAAADQTTGDGKGKENEDEEPDWDKNTSWNEDQWVMDNPHVASSWNEQAEVNDNRGFGNGAYSGDMIAKTDEEEDQQVKRAIEINLAEEEKRRRKEQKDCNSPVDEDQESPSLGEEEGTSADGGGGAGKGRESEERTRNDSISHHADDNQVAGSDTEERRMIREKMAAAAVKREKQQTRRGILKKSKGVAKLSPSQSTTHCSTVGNDVHALAHTPKGQPKALANDSSQQVSFAKTPVETANEKSDREFQEALKNSLTTAEAEQVARVLRESQANQSKVDAQGAAATSSASGPEERTEIGQDEDLPSLVTCNNTATGDTGAEKPPPGPSAAWTGKQQVPESMKQDREEGITSWRKSMMKKAGEGVPLQELREHMLLKNVPEDWIEEILKGISLGG
ncbi:hypothetical protein EG329_006569 [Mollisiaceae sp. DMI_Dod_QoI]|nr:hypothetical protein EG329_006569 [Helotiales sp. DMI_Dod_QoI]